MGPDPPSLSLRLPAGACARKAHGRDGRLSFHLLGTWGCAESQMHTTVDASNRARSPSESRRVISPGNGALSRGWALLAQEGQLLSEEEDPGVCLPPTILQMMLGKLSPARPWGTSLSTPQHSYGCHMPISQIRKLRPREDMNCLGLPTS